MRLSSRETRLGLRPSTIALFFGWHVFWPHGWDAVAPLRGIDPTGLVIGVAAALALFRFKAGVIPVIFACGAAGLAIRLLAPV